MIGRFRSEWIKWRSLRSSWTLWLCILGLTIAIGTLFAIAVTQGRPDGRALTESDILLALGGNALLLLLTFVLLSVIGALIVTTEYSQNTIAPTFLNSPRRVPVIVTKLALAVVIGLVTAALAQLLVIVIGTGVLNLNSVTLPSTSTIATQFLEATIYSACGVLFGFALGLLLRQSVFAVVTCIIWAVLIEPIAQAILAATLGADTTDKIARFFPIASLDGVMTIGSDTRPSTMFPPLVSLGIFLAYIVVAVGIGAFFVNRADTK